MLGGRPVRGDLIVFKWARNLAQWMAQGTISVQNFVTKFRLCVFDTLGGGSYPQMPDGDSSAEGLNDCQG